MAGRGWWAFSGGPGWTLCLFWARYDGALAPVSHAYGRQESGVFCVPATSSLTLLLAGDRINGTSLAPSAEVGLEEPLCWRRCLCKDFCEPGDLLHTFRKRRLLMSEVGTENTWSSSSGGLGDGSKKGWRSGKGKVPEGEGRETGGGRKAGRKQGSSLGVSRGKPPGCAVT